MILSRTYVDGLYNVIPTFGIILSFFIVGWFVAPRVGIFLGYNSVASVLGDFYGNRVKIITAVAGFIGATGLIAVQFKVAGSLLQYFLGVPYKYSLFIGSFVVILYSVSGGVRAVTLTDVIQLVTFVVFIPTMGYIVWQDSNTPENVFNEIKTNPIFDWYAVLDYKNPRFFEVLFLFLYYSVPKTAPAFFQRVSMAKDIQQVRSAFIYAALVLLCVESMVMWIATLLLSIDHTLSPTNLVSYMIDNYSYVGLKGLIVSGVMAMIMSTADSHINASSILLTETIQPFKKLSNKLELNITKFFALLLCLLSIILSFSEKDLLGIILSANALYMPIVTVPLIITIFGFRSTSVSILTGMFAGLLTVIVSYFYDFSVDIIVPAMIMNLLFCLGSHYVFKMPGGWIGNKSNSDFIKYKAEKRERIEQYKSFIKNFNFFVFLRSRTLEDAKSYVFLGVFGIISVYTSMYAMDQDVRTQYKNILDYAYYSSLIISSSFLTFPMWSPNIKSSLFLSCFSFVTLFYVLSFLPALQVIISDFDHFHFTVFILSAIILSSLLRWEVSLFFILFGVLLSILFLTKWNTEMSEINNISSLGFKISYILVFISSILIVFFKPKQEYLEYTEKKVDELETEVTYLDHGLLKFSKIINMLNKESISHCEKISDQEKEISRLEATAQKILNNVNHELRLPVGNVMNFSQMLYEGLEKHSTEKLRELSDEVYKNSTHLSSMILNMLDLANLDVKRVNLEKTVVNFSEIVKDRVRNCQRVYLRNKPLDFKLLIDKEILILVDPNYLRQVIDNLVINAINFSEKGMIEIKVQNQENSVIFTITDQGVGIAREELFDIFLPFRVGSNNSSKAEGRGIGLALCKSVVEAHGGSITAKSKGKGASFRFVLPK